MCFGSEKGAASSAAGPANCTVKATVPLQLVFSKQPARIWKLPLTVAVWLANERVPQLSSFEATCVPLGLKRRRKVSPLPEAPGTVQVPN